MTGENREDGERLGRPCALTPEVRAKLLRALKLGLTRTAAASVAGISGRTLRRWVERGEKGEEPFADLLEAVEVAEGRAQGRITLGLIKASDDDPKIAQWLLERRWPDDWQKRTTEAHDVDVRDERAASEMMAAADEVRRRLEARIANVINGAPEEKKRARELGEQLATLSPERLADVEALLAWQRQQHGEGSAQGEASEGGAGEVEAGGDHLA